MLYSNCRFQIADCEEKRSLAATQRRGYTVSVSDHERASFDLVTLQPYFVEA
jgi:hypothetical protein